MARKRTRTIVRYAKRAHRRAAKTTVPLAVLAGFVPLTKDVWGGYKSGGAAGAGHYLVGDITGYDSNTGGFNVPWALNHFWLPVGAGILVHKVASRLGVNRALGRAGVPFIRV